MYGQNCIIRLTIRVLVALDELELDYSHLLSAQILRPACPCVPAIPRSDNWIENRSGKDYNALTNDGVFLIEDNCCIVALCSSLNEQSFGKSLPSNTSRSV